MVETCACANASPKALSICTSESPRREALSRSTIRSVSESGCGHRRSQLADQDERCGHVAELHFQQLDRIDVLHVLRPAVGVVSVGHEAAGIDSADIQTSGFGVNPNYVYSDNKDANGYHTAKKPEHRVLETLLKHKVVKKGPKHPETKLFHYQVSTIGKKYLESGAVPKS